MFRWDIRRKFWARIVCSVFHRFHRESSFSLHEGAYRLRLERPCCRRRQMTVWPRVWVIRTLLRGVNSIRGQNPLGLCLDVRLSGFDCLPDPPVLPTGSALRISAPLPEGSLTSAPPMAPGAGRMITDWTAELSVQILGVRRSAVYRWKPGIWMAASSPSVSGIRRMSGVVPAPVSSCCSCLDCECCSGGNSFPRSDCVIQILPLHNQPDSHSYDGGCW